MARSACMKKILALYSVVHAVMALLFAGAALMLTVIAARTVVTKDVPANAVVAGIPARLVKTISPEA